MENIWGPQRKTGNMEEESLREENRKAHEEDERFRMTAVKRPDRCVSVCAARPGSRMSHSS